MPGFPATSPCAEGDWERRWGGELERPVVQFESQLSDLLAKIA